MYNTLVNKCSYLTLELALLSQPQVLRGVCHNCKGLFWVVPFWRKEASHFGLLDSIIFMFEYLTRIKNTYELFL